MEQDQLIVMEVLAEHTGRAVASIAPDAGLADIGLDSLRFLMVILGLEERLRRKVVDIAGIGNLHTVQDLLDLAGSDRHA